MSVIAAKSEYIYSANSAYSNLQEYEEIFEKEASVISYLKCALLRNDDIDDFYVNGIGVNVYETSSGYELYFDSYVMDVDVYDKQIIDFEVRR